MLLRWLDNVANWISSRIFFICKNLNLSSRRVQANSRWNRCGHCIIHQFYLMKSWQESLYWLPSCHFYSLIQGRSYPTHKSDAVPQQLMNNAFLGSKSHSGTRMARARFTWKTHHGLSHLLCSNDSHSGVATPGFQGRLEPEDACIGGIIPICLLPPAVWAVDATSVWSNRSFGLWFHSHPWHQLRMQPSG